jgi:hypothetical protein
VAAFFNRQGLIFHVFGMAVENRRHIFAATQFLKRLNKSREDHPQQLPTNRTRPKTDRPRRW